LFTPFSWYKNQGDKDVKSVKLCSSPTQRNVKQHELKAKFFTRGLIEQTFKYNVTSIRLILVRTLPKLKSSPLLAEQLLQVTPWQFLRHPTFIRTSINMQSS
jgi:hypothetical protein